MPKRLDGQYRAGELTGAVNHVLAQDGPAGLTIRRIAAASGLSHASIYHHLGSREHVVRVAFYLTSRARQQRLAVDARHDLVDALLPRTAEDLVEARCWLAWLEVTRVEKELKRPVEEWHARELATLTGATGRRLDRDQLEGVRAMTLGLLSALCQPQDPMPLADAQRILRAHLELIDPAQRTDSAFSRSSETMSSGESAE